MKPLIQRRTLLQAILAAAFLIPALTRAAATTLEVYKSAGCSCCEGWIEHLKTNGFAVKAQDVGDPGAYRQKFDTPNTLGSCYTEFVHGYAVEGHVPAAYIKRMRLPITSGVPAPYYALLSSKAKYHRLGFHK